MGEFKIKGLFFFSIRIFLVGLLLSGATVFAQKEGENLALSANLDPISLRVTVLGQFTHPISSSVAGFTTERSRGDLRHSPPMNKFRSGYMGHGSPWLRPFSSRKTE